MDRKYSLFLLLGLAVLQGCSGGSDATTADAAAGAADPNVPDPVAPNPVPPNPTPPNPAPPADNDALDDELRALIAEHNLTGDPSTGRNIPSIADPLAQLGMQLFFTKSLGGEFDSACVSCHHPALGGGDALSLPVGIGANDPDVLGPGRRTASGAPNVPRNSPTTVNVALWDGSLFWDSRVESLGKDVGQNGAASGISTPDSGFNAIDFNAGANLPTAQARFPVTSVEEMRGALEAGADNDAVRNHLAARIGNYGVGAGEITNGNWLNEFQSAFASADSAENLITFDNIVLALGAYMRSQTFVNSPWRAYVQGNNSAISDSAKRGAILFYSDRNDDGADCVQCHSGDLLSDEEHHTIGAPQFGPGKGNTNDGDFGRENITANAFERFRFRTPSLLNVAVTGPYMHTGAYESLDDVVRHYDNPNGTVDDFFDDGGWCALEQFENLPDCEDLYPFAEQNSNAALNKVDQERRQNDPAALENINLNNGERRDIVMFLEALTDPCVESRLCVSPWIPAPGDAADEHQLNATDAIGNAL